MSIFSSALGMTILMSQYNTVIKSTGSWIRCLGSNLPLSSQMTLPLDIINSDYLTGMKTEMPATCKVLIRTDPSIQYQIKAVIITQKSGV